MTTPAKKPSREVQQQRDEKKTRKCECSTCDEVRSANGATLYGWRCRHCGKQYQRSTCSACGVIAEHVARQTRKSWTCRKCIRAAESEVTGKAAE
jgi:ribosomal protein L37AE/L43A